MDVNKSPEFFNYPENPVFLSEMESMDLYELVKQDENELEIFLEDHPELFTRIDKVKLKYFLSLDFIVFLCNIC